MDLALALALALLAHNFSVPVYHDKRLYISLAENLYVYICSNSVPRE